MAVLGDQLTSLLSLYWGYSSFTDSQIQVIDSVLSGKDTVALIPTGGGKSVCYQIPALYGEGIVVVISPLIALMQDQVRALRAKNIAAVHIHSAQSKSQIKSIYNHAVNGKYKLIYMAPERLQSEAAIQFLKQGQIALIAVDEAHCISQWGHDFRPSYLNIKNIRGYLPCVPIVALTATATPKIIDDIVQYLDLNSPLVYREKLKRDNLQLTVFKTYNRDKEIISLLKNVHRSESGIIYVRSRKETLRLSNLLAPYVSSGSYHAGLSMQERKTRQHDWIKGSVQCMIATNAFGMGIDKADVRYIIHYGIPPSIEDYTQEIGRAGRDKQDSNCYLFYNDRDIYASKKQLGAKYPPVEVLNQVFDELLIFTSQCTYLGDCVWKFDFQQFTKESELSRLVVYSSLQQLIKEEYIELLEIDSLQSTVLVKTTDFDILDTLDDTSQEVIKAILSTYIGCKYRMTSFSESEISDIVNHSTKDIIELLHRLQKKDIIAYQEKNDGTYIHIKRQKFDLESVSTSYKFRISIDMDRLQTMHSYVQSESCLQQYLSVYYGDSENEICGTCIICKKNGTFENLSEREVNQKIFSHLSEEGIKLDSLISKFDFSEREWVKTHLGNLEIDGNIYIKDKIIYAS